MGGKPIDVLLIEDNPADARWVTQILQSTNENWLIPACRITHSARLDEGLRCLAGASFDVILCDLTLPDSQGAETFRRLRQAAPGSPLIVMTGSEDDDQARQAVREGAQDYIPKNSGAAYSLTRAIRYAIDRKQAEQHNAYQSMLVESISDAVISTDANFVILSWNKAAERLHGYTAQEAIGRSTREVLSGDYLGITRDEAREQLLATGQWEGEVVATRKDGSPANVWLSATLLRDSQGDTVGMLAINRDITERKRAELALQESEAGFRLLFADNPHPMWVYDLQTLEFLEVNQAAIGKYGYSRDEFLSMSLLDIRPAEDAPQLMAHMRGDRPELQQSGPWRHLLKDGRTIWVEIASHTLRFAGRQAVLVVAQDVGARLQAERALRDSEARYRTLAESAQDMIFILDLQQRVAYINGYGARAFSRTPEEMIGLSTADLFPPETLSGQPLDVRQAIETRWPVYAEILTALPGGPRWLGTSLVPLQDEAGTLSGLLGIARDITQQKLAEEALRTSEERFRALLENSADAIALLDREGKLLLFHSQASVRILGYAGGDNEGRQALALVHPDDRAQVAELLEQILVNPSRPLTTRCQVAHKDGSWRWVEATVTNLLEVPGVRALVVNYRDITDKKRGDDELRMLWLAVEQSPTSIIITDTHANIQYINPEFARTTGYTREEVLDRNPRLLQSGLTPPEEYERLWSALAKGQVWQGEFANRKKNGELYWEAATISPITDAQGRITNYLAIKEDITERKEIEKALLRYTDELTVLHAVAVAGTETTSEAALIERATEIIGATLYPDNFGVLLLDEPGSRLVPHRSYRGLDQDAETAALSAGHSLAWQVASSGQPRRVGDASLDSHDRMMFHESRSELCVPLKVGARVLGVINAESRSPGAYTEADEKLLITLAGQLATGIEKARLVDALRKSEVKFRSLVEQVPAITYEVVLGPESRTTYISPQIEAIQGFSPEEWLADPDLWIRQIHPEDRPWVLEEIQKHQAEASSIDIEYRALARDGRVIWIRNQAAHIRGEAGQPDRLHGLVFDMTERKQFEAALRESERRFRLLFDASPDAIVLLDPHDPETIWSIVDCNEAACQMNGYTRAELIGQSIDMLNVKTGARADFAENLEYLRRQGVVHAEAMHRHRDGRIFPVEFATTIITVGGRELVLGIDRDVTERRRAEEALRISEERFRFIAQATNDAIWDWDLQTEKIWWSDAFTTLFGYQLEQVEWTSDTWMSHIHPDDKERVFSGVRQALESGRRTWSEEYRFRRADGTYAYVIDRGYVVHDRHQNAIRMLGSMMDITKRNTAEEALRASEARLSEALHIAHLAYWERDSVNDLFLFNDQFYTLLRTTAEREGGYTMPVARYVERFVHPDDVALVRAAIQKTHDTADPNYSHQIDHRIRYADGETGYVTVNLRIEKDARGRTVKTYGANQDITERKQAEERITYQAMLLENVSDAILAVDANFVLTSWNKTAEVMFGYAAEEVIGRSEREVLDLRTPGTTRDALLQHLWKAGQWKGEIVIRRKEGGEVHVLASLSVLKSKAGEVSGYLAIGHDITQRIHAEARIASFADLGKQLGGTRTAEEAARIIVGVADELLGWDACSLDLYAERDDRIIPVLTMDIIEGRRVELPAMAAGAPGPLYRRVLTDGKLIVLGEDAVQFASDLIPFGDTTRLSASLLFVPIRHGPENTGVLTIQSYTPNAYSEEDLDTLQALADHCGAALDRIWAEEALRQSETRYRAIVEEQTDLICRLRPDGTITFANEAYLRQFHPASGSVIGRNVFMLTPEDVRTMVERQVASFSAENPFASYEQQTVQPDGTVRWYQWNGHAIFDAQGAVVEVQATGRDITERKQRERELEAIATVSAALRSAATHGDMLSIILHQVMDWLHPDSSGLVMKDLATGEGVQELVLGLNADWTGRRRPEGKGIGGHVMATGQPYRTNDPHHDPVVFDASRLGEIASVGGAPLIAQGATIGALWASQNRRMTESELRVLIAIADIAANALRRAALHEETRKRAEQLAAVNRLGRALAETLELAHIYEQCREAIFSLLPDTTALFISAYSPDTRLIQLLYGYQDGRLLSLSQAAPVPLQNDAQGECVRARKPVIVNDAGAAPAEASSAPAAHSMLYAPMTVKAVVTGVIQVHSRPPRHFDENDADLLAFVANTAAIAIENARLFAETRKQLERLQALRTIDGVVTASLDLRVTLSILLEQVTAQLDVDAAAILLLHPHTHTLEYSAGRGFRTQTIERTQLRIGEDFPGRAALERQPVFTNNLAAAGAGFKRTALLTEEGFAAYYAVPLITKGNVKGVLELYHRAPLAVDFEWEGFAETLAGQAAIAIENITLFNELQRSNTELTLAYDITLEGWTRALDLRDKETEGHTQRVTEMSIRIGRALGLDEIQLLHLRRGALLHDIGNFGVPDTILRKPGPLTDEEWTIVRKHPEYAYNLLRPITFLRQAIDVPYCHHERWDGSGYPRGLKADQIPLAARIYAVIDVWDALQSDRPYRPAWPADQVRGYLADQAGKTFDPKVVQIFLKLNE